MHADLRHGQPGSHPDGRNGIAEFGMLPLSQDGQSVSHFLTVEDTCDQVAGWTIGTGQGFAGLVQRTLQRIHREQPRQTVPLP